MLNYKDVSPWVWLEIKHRAVASIGFRTPGDMIMVGPFFFAVNNQPRRVEPSRTLNSTLRRDESLVAFGIFIFGKN